MFSEDNLLVGSLFPSSSLRSRNQAKDLFEEVKQKYLDRNKTFNLNFYDVEFVSRSFADELIKLFTESQKSELIHFCCMRDEIQGVFSTVKATQNGKSTKFKFPVIQFSDTASLINYFS